MARGSDKGGEGGGATTHTGIEMLGGGGGMDNRGKTTLTKKYFVTNKAELEAAPIISGYAATNISYTRLNDTAYEQNVTYEAQSAAQGTGTTVWLQNGVKGTFEMFCSYETKPIGKHPRILKLVEQYGGSFTGTSDPVYFPPTYNPPENTGLKAANAIKNPMFQVINYKEITLTLRHTYFSETVNPNIWDTAGRIVDKLPAGIPIPKGEKDKDGTEIPRRWMMQAPAVSRQGEAWQVVQEYVLLDAAGVADGLYERGTVPGTTA